MEIRVKVLPDGYNKEKERVNLLKRNLNDNYQKIKMLINGSQNLNKILAMGKTKSQYRGLGYNSGGDYFGESLSDKICFVKAGNITETQQKGLGVQG